MSWHLLVLAVVLMLTTWARPLREQASSDCETARVRQELDERYAQLADANRRKDLDALFALRARDYVADLPDGTQLNYDAAANYSRAMFDQVQKIANLSNTILKLNLKGNEGTATVFQQFSRTQTKAGSVRNVDTSAIQDETWVRTPQGLELRRVSHIRARKWYVDGKRVDPNKPYDPQAPPYNPPIDADE
jgi:ketosteroid isomerase-like protein